jgi:lactate dehydrogenase-like 2-hydroxyacid dehydrogenase
MIDDIKEAYEKEIPVTLTTNYLPSPIAQHATVVLKAEISALVEAMGD